MRAGAFRRKRRTPLARRPPQLRRIYTTMLHTPPSTVYPRIVRDHLGDAVTAAETALRCLRALRQAVLDGADRDTLYLHADAYGTASDTCGERVLDAIDALPPVCNCSACDGSHAAATNDSPF